MGNYRSVCVGSSISSISNMDVLELKVRSALKQKWMNNDHNINIKKMVDFYQTTPNVLIGIIKQYESELLATKFNLIE
jgi:hypothetical protein